MCRKRELELRIECAKIRIESNDDKIAGLVQRNRQGGKLIEMLYKELESLEVVNNE